MRLGDTIAGYRVISEPTNANGGKCIWAFAKKDGQEFFLKQFLDPKRPREGSDPAKPSVRIRLEVCEEFEARHRTIMTRLRPDARGGGNLVLARDFFHQGSTYYKVTERIDTSSLEKPEALEPRQKAVLLKTLGMSLQQLHDIDVVHGDLKPLNVLVQKRDGAAFHTAKLIDFDDSYVSGSPPGPQDIVGDSLYGAPEWRRYLQEDGSTGPTALTCAVDVFALGLMTHYYLTGAAPGHGDRYGSPADAVNAGEALEIDPRLSDTMRGLVRAMTARAPGGRPRMAGFLKALADPQVCALHRPRAGGAKPGGAAAPPAAAAGGAGGTAPRASRIRTNLKGSGARPAAPPAPAPSPSPAPSPAPRAEAPAEAPAPAPTGKTSRVRINLSGQRGSS
ncbi:lipopolysaccharide kinase InaA family protein [Streptomyces sp. NPDC001985]|uniref:protein kinase domain-containing protein n=1 Tax=Streptomyces sp. NPDC001985 TaxID=3154406 RepID=UPI0033229759